MLRSNDYKSVIRRERGKMISFNDYNYFKKLYEKIEKIEIINLHDFFNLKMKELENGK